MKLFLRILGAALLLAIVALVVTLLALPRLLDGETVRGRIQQAARDGLGRELEYESLEFGFLPPSVKVMQTVVSGETAADPPMLEAREIALRVALLPLLSQTVVVDSLAVDGAVLRLIREPDGSLLPTPDAPPQESEGSAAPAEGGSEGAAAGATEAEDAGVGLAVRSVRLTDTTLYLEDRKVKPAVSWELSDIAADARGRSLDDPIEIDLAATLGSGGSFRVEGTASREGALDLSAQLSDVVIDPLAPYLEADFAFGGRLGGTAKLSGPADKLEKVALDLHGDDVRFERGDVSVRGAVDVKADVADPTGAAEGSFELDATRAALEVGGGFTKPPGTPATVTGRIEPAEGGGLAFDDVRLLIKNFEAEGRVSSLDPLRAKVDAAPFAVDGWEEILPALAESPPTGRLRLDGLELQAEPPSVRGRLELMDLVLKPADAPAVALSGTLRGEGGGVVSEGLVAETGGQTLSLDAKLDELFGSPRYDVTVKSDGADSNALLTTLASKPDTLYGPLGLDARFRGALAGDPLASLGGRIDFGVADGRLVGVSPLKLVFEQLGRAGSLARQLTEVLAGRDLRRFYGDEFVLLRGVLDIRGGVAHTDDFALEYEDYGVKLRGTLGLTDLAVDMRGELIVGETLDAKLAKEVGRAKDDYRPRRRSIQIAAMTGTLDDPQIRVTSRVAVAFASTYLVGSVLDDALGQGAGEVLGEDAGRIVEGILDGVLGGGRRN